MTCVVQITGGKDVGKTALAASRGSRSLLRQRVGARALVGRFR